MFRTTRISATVIAAAAIGIALACADTTTAPPLEPREAQLSVEAPSLDIGGVWNWSNLESIRMPPEVANMVGVVPEGPNTHARCESSGFMNVTQTGSTFEGIAFKSSNSCTTKGGQSFQQAATVLSIANGRIGGRQLEFSFESFIIRPCPHRAVVEVAEGVAVALHGSGRCILPGHPQSESPLAIDPPPGGTSVTLEWEARRP